MRRSNFLRSGPLGGSSFVPGQKVQCVDANGSTLRKNAIYEVKDTSDCRACGGGIRLTSGPRPTDVACGWWDAKRFRPLDPPGDELTNRIRKAKPVPKVTTQPKVPELV